MRGVEHPSGEHGDERNADQNTERFRQREDDNEHKLARVENHVHRTLNAVDRAANLIFDTLKYLIDAQIGNPQT